MVSPDVGSAGGAVGSPVVAFYDFSAIGKPKPYKDGYRERLDAMGLSPEAAERVIAEEFMKFLMTGTLYQGSKPVMWSPVEKTALAEAEVEYEDKNSPAIDVAFEVHENHAAKLAAAFGRTTVRPSSLLFS